MWNKYIFANVSISYQKSSKIKVLTVFWKQYKYIKVRDNIEDKRIDTWHLERKYMTWEM